MKHAVPDWLLENPLGASISAPDVEKRVGPPSAWEDRFRALLDLADLLPVMPNSVRVDANRLHGCQATVWLVHAFDSGSGRLYINCASDTRLVLGLLACLLSGYNAQSLDAALAFDARAFVERLDFGGHIASERSNGLLAFIGRARMLAHRYSTSD